MSKELKHFIKESEKARKRFEALRGEERERAERQLKNLEDRMQSEENVTVLNKEKDS